MEIIINVTIFATVLIGLVVGAIILAIMVTRILKKTDNINLVQRKLKNSDSDFDDAMSYLKITNEWR